MPKFSAAELEAMRLADAEIDREFEQAYVVDAVHKEMDKWLDELAVADLMDNKSYHRRKKQKQYSTAYRDAHKDEIAAKQAAYRDAHKDEIAAYKAAYYDAHKDEIAAKQAAYRDAHKDEIAAKQAAYYDAHKDYWRNWYAKNRKSQRCRERVVVENLHRGEVAI